MGYYTSFSLSFESTDQERVEKELKELKRALFKEDSEIVKSLIRREIDSLEKNFVCDSEVFDALHEITTYDTFDGQVKWYSYDDDMKSLSRKFPNLLLSLTGHGEEDDDIWRAYYKGGQGYRVEAEIVFPAFDPSRLGENG